ncbi:MAG TPA: beta-ketoacyl-[acyl-carrier-protein] synthase family protein [Solirubrobacteraceae bacterium]|nr:beta-ketoacyl-[acyl-carrier-protein] synthase family protein [Solirubrobacteraceae bacterium]
MTRAVAVTGMGAITPYGVGAEALIDGWCTGEAKFADRAANCTFFKPEEYLSAKEARRTDRFSQLGIVAAEEALQQAGWGSPLPYDPYRIACVMGTAIGGLETTTEQHTVFTQEGPAGMSPLGIAMVMPNASAAALSMRYGLRGPSFGVAEACAAGADAIAMGVRLIRSGEVDAAVVGGAEAVTSMFSLSSFDAIGAMSKSGVCRPFDANRDGFVIGEGGGVLILEDESRARARGVEPLGRILGFGSSSDAFHLVAPDPSGVGATKAIELALKDAELKPADIDYVNAHGTGTLINDRVETKALKDALGEHAYRTPISSLKSAIGHLVGASGAVEAVATLQALRTRVAPPTLGHQAPDEELDLDYCVHGPKPLPNGGKPLTAISNSFAFGGHNFVLVIQGV